MKVISIRSDISLGLYLQSPDTETEEFQYHSPNCFRGIVDYLVSISFEVSAFIETGDDYFDNMLERSNCRFDKLTHLRISKLSLGRNGVATTFPVLRVLYVDGNLHTQDLLKLTCPLLESLIVMEHITTAWPYFTNGESFVSVIQRFPLLRKLVVDRSITPVTDHPVTSPITHHLPHLGIQEIVLRSTGYRYPDITDDCRETAFIPFLYLFPNLEDLRLSYCTFSKETQESYDVVNQVAQNVVRLAFDGWHDSGVVRPCRFARSFLSRCVNVTQLTMGFRDSESRFDLSHTVSRKETSAIPFDYLETKDAEGKPLYFPSLSDLELCNLQFDQTKNDLSNLLQFCLSRENSSTCLRTTFFGCVIKLAENTLIPFPDMRGAPISRILYKLELLKEQQPDLDLGPILMR